MFADFELQAHRLVEQDQPVTAEVLNAIYAALLREYYGDVHRRRAAVAGDLGAHSALLQHAVLRLPVRHVLRVDRAADAGPAIAGRGRGGGGGVARYLSLLRAGGSDYPMRPAGSGRASISASRTPSVPSRLSSTRWSPSSKRELAGLTAR